MAFVLAGKYWGAAGCEKNLPVGLVVIGICYLIQNFANFYTVYKYAEEYGKYGEFSQKRGDKGICEITGKFLCYDFFMCFYIIFLPFSLVWSGIFTGYASSSSKVCRRKLVLLIEPI